MKALMFECKKIGFLLDINNLLHVSDINEIQGEKEREILIFNFSKFLDGDTNPKYVIFLTDKKRYIGVLADKIYDIISYNEFKPFEKNNFDVKFIKGVVEYNNKLLYLLNAENLIEVAYEEKNNAH
ncbi:chemotaxis protein CheW [Deferribacter abyssi]|uniref:chemotaxis protein CheW n=1 Tax=Deferribacter abyssi TaxID=213806 RepID=UPI003C255BDF